MGAYLLKNRKSMKARYRIAGIGILVILLALIRYFQESLFYDPLLQFFASDYLQGETPHFETTGLLINVFYRFLLNSVISLAIIYIAFMDGNILKFSFFLYLILFGIGFPVFMFLIFTIENNNFLALFYVRRFLIHPIFVIILLPAFYYYRLNTRKTNKVERFSRKI